MKLFLMTLTLFSAMQNASATPCFDLGEPKEIVTGRFVPISQATRAEREIAAKHAANASSIFRTSNPSVIAFKIPSDTSSFTKIIVYNLKTGRITHSVGGSAVQSIAVSPSGDFVFLEDRLGEITMYRAGENDLVNRVPQHWETSGMFLTADGMALYVFSKFYGELIFIETRYLETGHSLPYFAGDANQGARRVPLTGIYQKPAIHRMYFEPHNDGRHVIIVGDNGRVTVIEHENEVRNVIPKIVYQNASVNMQTSFAQNSNPPQPKIRWTSDHTFEIEVDGQTEKFQFIPKSF